VFYGCLLRNLHHQHVYSGVLPVTGVIHLKVDIQCGLFSVGKILEMGPDPTRAYF